jgi:hypothetical protein
MDNAQLVRRLAALQGIDLAESRAEGVAGVLQRQLEAEKAATRKLAFETEPANFAATLNGGSK